MSPSQRFEQETLPHLPELRARARRLVGRSDLADDLVQETYLLAYRARRQYRLGTNARAWLHRILGNAASAARRRERRERHAAARLLDEHATVDPMPGMLLEVTERAIAGLPRGAREIIRLVDLEELGYAEAADRLGVPVGTVMSRLHRARRRLRQALVEKPPRSRAA